MSAITSTSDHPEVVIDDLVAVYQHEGMTRVDILSDAECLHSLEEIERLRLALTRAARLMRAWSR